MKNDENNLKNEISNLNEQQKQHMINMFKKYNYHIVITDNINERILNTILYNNENNTEYAIIKLKEFINIMIDRPYRESIIQDRTFSIFCYVHIANNKVFSSDERLIFFNDRHPIRNIINFRGFSSPSKMSNTDKINHDLIDFINIIECSKTQKHRYLDYLQTKYNQSKKDHSFSWLSENNKDLPQWSIDYFEKNKVIEKELRHLPILFNNKEAFRFTIPAIFHAMEISDAEKKLFLITMKKAWGQKKYRTKIKNEKKITLNLVVDEEIDKRLKRLSKEFDVPVNKIVSMMTIYLADKYTEIKALEEKKKNNKRKQLQNLM
ncbi:hypothetical protein [Vibrio fluvialis]|uniref:Uncharacterized protein n=3 Tax=Vibrionaceae TaxID=641 RepID=S7JPN9_VIBFL|nr:hypothetical protein [Vibrio fluvialis]EPP24145.1 hypothetical protein L910_2973 [Vibrio fluvialis PG41]MCE7653000.1 hypothetical protein [Vibrio fluvialis]MCG6382226.1 hypothetical protein [Vibrio fluvialis]WIE05835.1 hypothetical protein QN061_17615 [Vibrio fluvialis]